MVTTHLITRRADILTPRLAARADTRTLAHREHQPISTHRQLTILTQHRGQPIRHQAEVMAIHRHPTYTIPLVEAILTRHHLAIMIHQPAVTIIQHQQAELMAHQLVVIITQPQVAPMEHLLIHTTPLPMVPQAMEHQHMEHQHMEHQVMVLQLKPMEHQVMEHLRHTIPHLMPIQLRVKLTEYQQPEAYLIGFLISSEVVNSA